MLLATLVTADSVSRMGSDKTPRKCMEHYLDLYLGRYGHCLPPTLASGEPVHAGDLAHIPPHAKKGQEVRRAERIGESVALFKRMEKTDNDAEKDAIRAEAKAKGHTEPFSVDDITKMEGYDLVGFMPRRR